jgi:type II secretory pathway predicted ATPase ExeA
MRGAVYNSYFGFREIPFGVTPDPRFFYANSLYKEAFATLQYGIKNKKGFIVITGEVGTGKTTLLRKLMRQIEATIDSVFIFNTYLSFPELLQLVLQDLGLAYKEKTGLMMIQELNEYLMQQLQKGRTVCLLIDEAQNLNGEALEGLRLLSNLETDKEKLLQIVLVGQPELEIKLDQPKLRQLKQRITVRCRLDRLKDREVGSYIDYRLRAVGYERNDLFSPDAIQQILFYSKGIPRLINIICDNALLLAYASSRKKVSAEMVKEVARDLRLEPEAEVTKPDVPTTKAALQKGIERGDRPVQLRRSSLAWVGVGTFLLLLFLGAGGAVFFPTQTKDHLSDLSLEVKEFVGTIGENLESLGHDFNAWFAGLMPREAKLERVQASFKPQGSADLEVDAQGQGAPSPDGKALALAEQANPLPPLESLKTEGQGKKESPSNLDSSLLVGMKKEGVGGEWNDRPNDRPMVIKYGSTIIGIASKFYEDNNIFFALDLIKDSNPHIENLNWVIAGERLQLPPLRLETLLRKQSDGSYRLILGSFLSSSGAEKLVEAVRLKGYEVVITPRRVADNLLLHRVEIGGLKNLGAVNQAWDTALANRWFPFDK